MTKDGLVRTNENCVGCNKCIGVCSCMVAHQEPGGVSQPCPAVVNYIEHYVRCHNIGGPSCKDEIEYGLGSIYPTPGAASGGGKEIAAGADSVDTENAP